MMKGCEGARNSREEFIIWGSTLNQLDIRTEQVLNRIRKSGFKLNKNKCAFGATELIFLVTKYQERGFFQIQKKLG